MIRLIREDLQNIEDVKKFVSDNMDEFIKIGYSCGFDVLTDIYVRRDTNGRKYLDMVCFEFEQLSGERHYLSRFMKLIHNYVDKNGYSSVISYSTRGYFTGTVKIYINDD